MRRMLLVLLLVTAFGAPARSANVRDRLDALERLLSEPTVQGWRFQRGDTPAAASAAFDDSGWALVNVGQMWWPHDSIAWFRKRIAIPERLNGMRVSGDEIHLLVGMDNAADVFINGAAAGSFEWDRGDVIITRSAQPGQSVLVALRGINRPVYGRLMFARLATGRYLKMRQPLREFITLARYATGGLEYASPEERGPWVPAAERAVATINERAFRSGEVEAFLASVRGANAALLAPVATARGRLNTAVRQQVILRQDVERAQKMGRQAAYPLANLTVAGLCLPPAREDLAQERPDLRVRGARSLAFIESILRRGLEEVGDILKDPHADRAVPQFKTGPVEIRDGAFWQDGKPLYLIGVGHFGDAVEAMPVLPKMGLGAVQRDGGGPVSVLPAEGQVNTGALDAARAIVDRAAANNVYYDLLLAPHYFPDWAKDPDPDRLAGGHFISFNVNSLRALAVHERYLRLLMQSVARRPGLNSICLSNEAQYHGYDAYSLAPFHEWLRKRHVTIERLNAIYGTHYARFDDVPLPKRHEWASGEGEERVETQVFAGQPYAPYLDYCLFNQDRFMGFHEWLARIIHEYDPDLPVHAKFLPELLTPPGHLESGVDLERGARIGKISGLDATTRFEPAAEPNLSVDALDAAANLSFLRAAAPDQPCFNSEAHFIADDEQRYIPEAYLRAAVMLEAVMGQGAATMWVYGRDNPMLGGSSLLNRANCLWGLSRAALDLNRLGPQFHALSRAQAPVAIVYANSSVLPTPDHVRCAADAFRAAFFSGAPVTWITERGIEARGLSAFRLVIVPAVDYAPDSTLAGLKAYAAAGGHVLQIGPCFAFDEYARPRAPTKSLGEAVKWDRDARPDLSAPLAGALRQAGVAPPASWRGFGGPAMVFCREASDAQGRLLMIANLGRARVRITRVRGGDAATDLLTGERLRLAGLTLTPMQVRLLRLGPL